MKNRSSQLVYVPIVIIALSLLAGCGGNTGNTPPSFVKIGKTYEFGWARGFETDKVLEINTDGWAKVQEAGKDVHWVNLQLLNTAKEV